MTGIISAVLAYYVLTISLSSLLTIVFGAVYVYNYPTKKDFESSLYILLTYVIATLVVHLPTTFFLLAGTGWEQEFAWIIAAILIFATIILALGINYAIYRIRSKK